LPAVVIDPTLAEAEQVAWAQWVLTDFVPASTLPPAQRSFLDLATYYNDANYIPPKREIVPVGESFRMDIMRCRRNWLRIYAKW
jgi:hypothetical protein